MSELRQVRLDLILEEFSNIQQAQLRIFNTLIGTIRNLKSQINELSLPDPVTQLPGEHVV